jgi:hypothetical protein
VLAVVRYSDRAKEPKPTTTAAASPSRLPPRIAAARRRRFRRRRASPEPTLHICRLAVSTASSSLSSRALSVPVCVAPFFTELAAVVHVADVSPVTIWSRGRARCTRRTPLTPLNPSQRPRTRRNAVRHHHRTPPSAVAAVALCSGHPATSHRHHRARRAPPVPTRQIPAPGMPCGRFPSSPEHATALGLAGATPVAGADLAPVGPAPVPLTAGPTGSR